MVLTSPSSSSKNVCRRDRGVLELSVEELASLKDEYAIVSSKAAYVSPLPAAHQHRSLALK
jgi:hypothetical protein